MDILLEPLKYYKNKFDIWGVIIPEGYAFDGLSIPRLMQWIINMKESQNKRAGIIHDFDFSELSDSKFWESNVRLYRNLKGSFFAKSIIFLGVTIFGIFSYKRDTNYKKYKVQIEEYRKTLVFKKDIGAK